MPAHHQYIEIKIFGETKQVGKKEERKKEWHKSWNREKDALKIKNSEQ